MLKSTLPGTGITAGQRREPPRRSRAELKWEIDRRRQRRLFGGGGESVALDWYILQPEAHQELVSRGRRWFYRHGRVTRDTGSHVAMEEDAHHALFSRWGNLPLLRRAADYYEDAVYSPAEVGDLLSELVSAGPHAGAAAELVTLCREALRRQCGLIAIPD